MQIRIKDESSTLVYDSDYDDVELGNDYQRVHLHFRCRHDNIFYDRDIEDMWCPDCENEHLETDERLEYLRSHFEEGDYR